MRIQIEMPENRVRELETLMREAGITTKKELINNALTLFDWAIRQKKIGRVVGSFDRHESNFREVLLPVFANVHSTITATIEDKPSTFDDFLAAGIDTVAELERDKQKQAKQRIIDALLEIPTEDILLRISQKIQKDESGVARELIDTNGRIA